MSVMNRWRNQNMERCVVLPKSAQLASGTTPGVALSCLWVRGQGSTWPLRTLGISSLCLSLHITHTAPPLPYAFLIGTSDSLGWKTLSSQKIEAISRLA